MADISGKDLAYRTLASVLGGPVDLTTMVMRPFGYDVEKPVLGSEWIGQKMQNIGLVSDARNPTAEFLASLVVPGPGELASIGKGAMAVPALLGMTKAGGRIDNVLTAKQPDYSEMVSAFKTEVPISGSEKDVLAAYQRQLGHMYANKYKINPLSLGTRQRDEGELLASRLDKIFENIPASKTNLKVFRGVSPWDVSPDIKIGEVVDQKGWLSTSTNFDIGKRFAKEANRKNAVMWELNIPAGVKALPMDAYSVGKTGYTRDEKELLLESGLKIKVVGKRKEGDITVLTGEVFKDAQ